jgi:uncharacterized membrane protein YsdA (DUF1294 family)/cold shock CspA family protein
MTHQGRLTEWNDERGFGFVTPLGGGPTAFVHISHFPRHLRRPKLNDLLVYSIEYDQRGRPRASDISFLRLAQSKLEASGGWQLVPVIIVSVFSVVLGTAVLLGSIPLPVLGLYAFMSVVLYLMYAADKSAAIKGRWRTSEATLHLVALLGGWPGGLIARHRLRHKTIKQPFRFVFWCTVVLNCIGLWVGFIIYLFRT